MTNKVTEIFSSMTDDELVTAIQEMKTDDNLGIIRENGIIRNKCKIFHEIVGGNTYDHLTIVRFSILQEAAYRFTPHTK